MKTNGVRSIFICLEAFITVILCIIGEPFDVVSNVIVLVYLGIVFIGAKIDPLSKGRNIVNIECLSSDQRE